MLRFWPVNGFTVIRVSVSKSDCTPNFYFIIVVLDFQKTLEAMQQK